MVDLEYLEANQLFAIGRVDVFLMEPFKFKWSIKGIKGKSIWFRWGILKLGVLK